jgi:hypothetical protein
MKQDRFWEANSSTASQEFPIFYGNWRFISAFARGRHLSLSWARLIQPMPHILLLEDQI